MRYYKWGCSPIESHLSATQSNIENTNLLLIFVRSNMQGDILRSRNIRPTHGLNKSKIVHGASFISQQ